MDKETFELRRTWAKANIDRCDKEISELKGKVVELNDLLEIYEDDKKMYRKYLDETWEQYIDKRGE